MTGVVGVRISRFERVKSSTASHKATILARAAPGTSGSSQVSGGPRVVGAGLESSVILPPNSATAGPAHAHFRSFLPPAQANAGPNGRLPGRALPAFAFLDQRPRDRRPRGLRPHGRVGGPDSGAGRMGDPGDRPSSGDPHHPRPPARDHAA